MGMPVMYVRGVPVRVSERAMCVRVCVGLRFAVHVLVLMMRVVKVEMIVREPLVPMLVVMPLGSQEANADREQCRCRRIEPSNAFAQHEHGSDGAEEWCRRKVRRFPRGPDQAKGVGIQKDADPVADAAEQKRSSELCRSGRKLQAQP